MDVEETYERNLRSLHGTQPEVAATLAATEIPAGVVAAVGRDGVRTFRIPDSSGRLGWLGGSSMPSISAAETLRDFAAAGQNAALPGILTGVEAVEVLAKLPGYCALFVVERDPLVLKLVFRVRDYASAMEGGRLFFFLGDDWENTVEPLIRRNPGLLMPATLLTLPQWSADQIAACRAQLERAAQRASEIQTAITQDSVNRLHGSFGQSGGTVPDAQHGLPREGLRARTARLAVLSNDASPWTLEHARRIERSLAKLGWAHTVCVPDSPRNCHLAARILSVEKAGADGVLLLNSPRSSLRPAIPESIPIWSCYLPGGSLPGWRGQVKLGSVSHESQSPAVDHRPDECLNLSPAADDSQPRGDASRGGPKGDAVVIADLPDARAESLNISLLSHVALWESLRNAARVNPQRLFPESLAPEPATQQSLAAKLLEEAEEDCDIHLQEPELRRQFVALVEGCLIPSVAAERIAETLAADGRRYRLFGANWPALDGADSVQSSIPLSWNKIAECGTVSLAVFPAMDPVSIQHALDALWAGTPVLLRGNRETLLGHYPGLAALADLLPLFRSPNELKQHIRHLRYRPEHTRNTLSAAQEAIASRHTLSAHLAEIRSGASGTLGSRPQEEESRFAHPLASPVQ